MYYFIGILVVIHFIHFSLRDFQFKKNIIYTNKIKKNVTPFLFPWHICQGNSLHMTRDIRITHLREPNVYDFICWKNKKMLDIVSTTLPQKGYSHFLTFVHNVLRWRNTFQTSDKKIYSAATSSENFKKSFHVRDNTFLSNSQACFFLHKNKTKDIRRCESWILKGCENNSLEESQFVTNKTKLHKKFMIPECAWIFENFSNRVLSKAIPNIFCSIFFVSKPYFLCFRNTFLSQNAKRIFPKYFCFDLFFLTSKISS